MAELARCRHETGAKSAKQDTRADVAASADKAIDLWPAQVYEMYHQLEPWLVHPEFFGGLREDLGLNSVIAELNPGGMLSMEQLLRTLRILTHEVVPALK